MEWTILCVGKPKLSYALAGATEYADRLKHYVRIRMEWIKAGTAEAESERLLKASTGTFRIALDPQGWMGPTEAWLEHVVHWERTACTKVSFLIGGADGHHDRTRKEAHAVWALGPLTMQHELALVVLMEQLYRVQTLKHGKPYHRA
jgi:23S rRNA (pseudouridine1915-N3)-methyltransferase